MYLARRAMLLGEEPPPNMVGIARAQVSRCWPLPAAATARAEVRGQPGARLCQRSADNAGVLLSGPSS